MGLCGTVVYFFQVSKFSVNVRKEFDHPIWQRFPALYVKQRKPGAPSLGEFLCIIYYYTRMIMFIEKQIPSYDLFISSRCRTCSKDRPLTERDRAKVLEICQKEHGGMEYQTPSKYYEKVMRECCHLYITTHCIREEIR